MGQAQFNHTFFILEKNGCIEPGIESDSAGCTKTVSAS
jgi:hypothetical protein